MPPNEGATVSLIDRHFPAGIRKLTIPDDARKDCRLRVIGIDATCALHVRLGLVELEFG